MPFMVLWQRMHAQGSRDAEGRAGETRQSFSSCRRLQQHEPGEAQAAPVSVDSPRRAGVARVIPPRYDMATTERASSALTPAPSKDDWQIILRRLTTVRQLFQHKSRPLDRIRPLETIRSEQGVRAPGRKFSAGGPAPEGMKLTIPLAEASARGQCDQLRKRLMWSACRHASQQASR